MGDKGTENRRRSRKKRERERESERESGGEGRRKGRGKPTEDTERNKGVMSCSIDRRTHTHTHNTQHTWYENNGVQRSQGRKQPILPHSPSKEEECARSISQQNQKKPRDSRRTRRATHKENRTKEEKECVCAWCACVSAATRVRERERETERNRAVDRLLESVNQNESQRACRNPGKERQ